MPAPTQPDPLSQLHDIVLPHAISAWPPAPGWWLLAIISIILIITSLRFMITQRHQTAGKRDALKQLKQLDLSYQQTGNKQDLLSQLSQLLKRIALLQHRDNSKPIAGLQGEDWLRFLDKQAQAPLFNQGIGRRLIHAPYQANTDLNDDDCKQLLYLSRTWLQKIP